MRDRDPAAHGGAAVAGTIRSHRRSGALPLPGWRYCRRLTRTCEL